MKRLVIVVAAAACGASPKPPPTAPLPDEPKPAETATATPPAAATPAKPAAPAQTAAPTQPAAPPAARGPLEVKIPAAPTTVKLVSSGTGKKQAIRYTFTQGAKQPVELVLDFTGKQDADEKIVPTIVLTGSAETTAVDRDGTADYTMTVTSSDAREAPGSQVPLDQFRSVLGGLAGLTIGGKLGASGPAGDVTLRLENPPPGAADTLDLLRVALPRLPVLPKEAIGVGARWQATSSTKLADRLDVNQVTDYEVVAHDGATWKITGKTTVSGKDQELEGAKITALGGTGTSAITIAGGALYPVLTSTLETKFTASQATQSTQFAIKVGGAITAGKPRG